MVTAESNIRVEELSQVDALGAANTERITVGAARESLWSFSKRSVLELTNIKFALASFVINNLRRRYRRSVLGFAWSLLNPLMTMAVMTGVFSMLFRHEPRAFAIYVFTGLLPWTFIMDALTGGGQAIVANEHFLKKVYIPKLFFPLVVVCTEGANFVFSLGSLMIMGLALGGQMHVTWLLVPFAVSILFCFCYSVAVFLAVATVYFRDLTHIIKVVLGLLFYLVPIIYPLSVVPQEYQFAFKLNPIYPFINLFRLLIVDGTVPSLTQWLAPIVVTFVCAGIAFTVLKRTERDIIYRL